MSTPWYKFRHDKQPTGWPTEFDSTANRHVEGNLTGFIYATPASSSSTADGATNPEKKQQGKMSSGAPSRRRRDI